MSVERRARVLLTAGWLALAGGVHVAVALPQDATPDSDPAERPDLRDELLALVAADQRAREPFRSMFAGPAPPDSASLALFAARLDSVDAANRAALQRMIDEEGWPTRTRVGLAGAKAAFLLAQHADRDLAFQRLYLDFLELEYQAGQASGEWLAMLTDRVRVAEGRRQLYGTQVTIEDREAKVQPIEDEQSVDERRARLGLPPLAEYLGMVASYYQIEAGGDANER